MRQTSIPIDHADEIAELLALLHVAAAAGDVEAAIYLRGYEPWALAQLATVTRH